MEQPMKNLPQPHPSAIDVTDNTRKRPLENDVVFPNSKHIKLRHILKDLRPHFLVVLRTPDFRKCKEADEIREQMKLLVDQCKQALPESTSLVDNKKGQSQPPKEKGQTDTSAPLNQTGEADEPPKGTYLVGGSVFGYNFITFTGKDSEYYGVTKEAFRSTHPAPQ